MNVASIEHIINQSLYRLGDRDFVSQCREQLDSEGVLTLTNFITADAIDTICAEAHAEQHYAFYSTQKHNVYLDNGDDSFTPEHVRNRLVVSTKGCITDDRVPQHSPLRQLYDTTVSRLLVQRLR